MLLSVAIIAVANIVAIWSTTSTPINVLEGQVTGQNMHCQH